MTGLPSRIPKVPRRRSAAAGPGSLSAQDTQGEGRRKPRLRQTDAEPGSASGPSVRVAPVSAAVRAVFQRRKPMA